MAVIPLMTHASVESTGRGKIDFTGGHRSPNYRTVKFIENGSGATKTFRISDVQGSDISSVILMALATQSDVQIWFDPAVTTGCGSEPKIEYVRVYRD